MYRPYAGPEWKIWWYPDGTTGSAYAITIRLPTRIPKGG